MAPTPARTSRRACGRVGRAHRRRLERVLEESDEPTSARLHAVEQQPVVGGERRPALDDVARHVVAHGRGVGEDDDPALRVAGRPGPDVVADVVRAQVVAGHAARDPAVVVDHVVAHVEERPGRPAVVVAEARVPRRVVGPEVVVERDPAGGPHQGTVAVRALAVDAAVQGLRDQAPLDGDIGHVAAQREALVHRPAGRAVVEDHTAGPASHGERVDLRTGDVAGPEPQVAHDHVVGQDLDRLSPEADAAAGRRLAGDRQEGLRDHDLAEQRDQPAHPEDHRARARGPDRVAEAAGARVVEVADDDDAATAAAGSRGAKALGPGEGQRRARDRDGCREQQGEKSPIGKTNY